MTDASKDDGVLFTLIERFQKQRLPRAQAIKKKVDNGDVLSDEDLAFLKRVLDDAHYIKPLVDKHPEWKTLASQATSLYKEIVDKALENEKASS